MVLNDYRDRADVILIPIARVCKSISPNTLTFVSLLLAIATGFAYAYSGESDHLLLAAFILLLLSSLFDALDGKVARITGKSSVRGDLLDHVIDRYSDIFIIAGITFSPFCPEIFGFVAIISVLMLSYMGTQAQAVGGSRNYGGMLGRADRLMLILAITLIQYLLMVLFSVEEVMGYYLLTWLMLLFILLGNMNTFQRMHDTWIKLGEKEPDHAEDGNGMRNEDPQDDIIEWKGH